MDSKRFAHFPARGTLMILLAAVLTAGCGISKAKYLDLTHNRDDLAAKNQMLQSSLDTANKDKADLESSKAVLEARLREKEAAVAEQQKSADDAKATYERLIGHLKGELGNGKIEIQQMRDGVNVNLAQDILFRSGSSELDDTGSELLLKVADDLKASPFDVLVNGHTDNQRIGRTLASRYPTNWELGAARAARIVRLFEEAGIPKERMAAVSFSDSRPRESNETEEGRAKNRRIEIRLRPTVSEQTAGE